MARTGHGARHDRMESGMSAMAWGDVLGADRAAAGPGARRHLALVPTRPEVARPGLRITRRGRLLVTTALLGALVALTLLLWSPSGAPSAAAAGTAAGASVVVAPGQTLTELASVHLPGMPVADAVARIRIANNLPSAQVSAGQRLVIPKT